MRLHRLTDAVLQPLYSVVEESEAVAFLLDAELSRRMLLLRAILDAIGGSGVRPEDAEETRRAWCLLESAERRAPAAFREVLLDPQSGVWAASLLRRLSRPSPAATEGEAPLRVELGFLAQLAATVFVTAGIDFRTPVPLRDGRVFLPGLGRATFGGDPWGTAEVWGRDGLVRIAAGGVTVTLPDATETDAPGWEGQRQLRAEHKGAVLALAVDDLGPYAPVPELGAPARLSEARFGSWQRWFEGMWCVLVEDHTDRARALATGLRSLVPLPPGERLRARAASSSDAFGALLLSEPDEDADVVAAQLGVAVLHELRHTLLNGLLFLAPLFDDCDQAFYAPWRDDPRTLGGLTHGVYAFSGVARFWRAHGPEGLAGFEFALWRGAVRTALETLRGHPALTPPGHALIGSLEEQTEGWSREPVGERERRLAHLATVHHRATWRAHHLRVPAAYAGELADAWRAGRPADTASEPEPTLRADPSARRLDTLALLARLRIVAPGEFDALHAAADPGRRIPGVVPADLALVDGDAATALKLYADELAGPGARPAAWAGLGLALAECGEPGAAAALTERPEVALAVAGSSPARPDPVALARWLAR
ncbi:aKG-HExxH-type peptide beta-hydroxylase [Streptomyces cadmiisoli]|uniref:aKG-HExxH-type peptide beta-hydroxylase n=1 Tax=Streptomyces cadmiisoli TaxID=2184053 RepID=UPI003657351C